MMLKDTIDTDPEISVLWLRPPKGQVSVRRERIAEHLRPRGFDVTLLDATVPNVFRAAKAAATGDVDVLVGNVRLGLYIGYPLSVLTRTPFIADVSDPLSDIEDLPTLAYRLLSHYEWWILTRVDEAVYVPEVYRIARDEGCNGRVAPNAVDFEKFANPEPLVVDRCAELLEAEGVELDKPIALYVGVFSEGRNIDALIDAAELLTDWQVVFVGEGPLVSEVQEAANRSSNVFFPGAFEHDLMPGFMAHASVGLCLVDIERPIKIAEYGAAGLPVLGTFGKLQREFSDDEICFVEATQEEIAGSLERMSANPDRRSELVENLRADAREHSWSAVAEVYEAAFDAVLGAARADEGGRKS